MEELIIQALLELAGEEGYRGNVQRLLEGHGEANIASDLAVKLLAKGVQLPHNYGLIDITYLLD